ncbi:MAG: Rieske 2Fe-2S domain-containing protein [Burkholderiales bacterium]|nr:Rieske 2Fe-2S domain-containing protein [Burkholderiales bacterium]
MNAPSDLPRARGRYRDDPAALRALVREDAVHRDVYVDGEVFELEMERLWSRTWVYVGHDSQVPKAGDYATADVAGRPVMMVRGEDGAVRVVMNRCAHKGAKLVSEGQGSVGRFFRCPYHAWAYELDGRVRAIPLKSGYEQTGFAASEAAGGLSAPAGVAVHRGFVFARLEGEGPSFDDWAGPMRAVIDAIADRSPRGALRVVGAPLRSTFRANWKAYIENINDTVHPPATHQSANDAAGAAWAGRPAGAPKPMSMQLLLPFGSGWDFFERMGGRVLPSGHSLLGTQASIHSSYEGLEGYEASLVAAHGETRARAVLAFAPQNAVLYPSVSMKATPQAIRVIRPVAVDRTVVEAWAFQPEGAPELLARRAVTYNRLVFSPMSVLAHDDLHVFETIQHALRADGNPWVSLRRGLAGPERDGETAEVGGTDERLIRNQFRAWAAAMALGPPALSSGIR